MFLVSDLERSSPVRIKTLIKTFCSDYMCAFAHVYARAHTHVHLSFLQYVTNKTSYSTKTEQKGYKWDLTEKCWGNHTIYEISS